MHRHRAMTTSFTAILAGALAACSADDSTPAAGAAPGARARPPNVVVVVLDTARGDRCSVNGYSRPTTPELEALALEGTRYRDCWTPSPWTAPAHASLFTGLRPSNHGLMDGVGYVLPEEFETLAESLSRLGYATACFTANDFLSPSFGLTQGFEDVERTYVLPPSAYPFAPGAHERAAKWALDARRRGSPFFLFINDIEPHSPYTPPEPFAGAFAGDATAAEIRVARELGREDKFGFNIGLVPLAPRLLEVMSRLYDAEIATVDEAVGQLVRRLRDAGVLDDTVFVVVGDHGENLGDHGLVEHVFSVHRTLLHVPLVIRFPRAFEAGGVVDDVVRLEDLHATLLELCGAPPTAQDDGVSLTRPTAGRVAIADCGYPELAITRLRELFPAADLASFAVSMRSAYDGRHHLIQVSDGREMLYDVEADPAETTDLAASQPDIVARLRALLPR